MSSLHSMKKEIKKRNLRFAPDMYSHTLGSVIISAWMLSEDKPDPVKINKTWYKICKKPQKYIDFWIEDPDFIDKALALFEIKRPEEFPIAMVQSEYNVLFMPYVQNVLYPLREDGIFSQTAKKGKIYPIDFTTNINDGEVVASTKPDNGDK